MPTCPNCGEQADEATVSGHFDNHESMYSCAPNGGGWGSSLLKELEAMHRKHRELMRQVGNGASDEALEEMMLALGHLGNAMAAVRRRTATKPSNDAAAPAQSEGTSLEVAIQKLPLETLRNHLKQLLSNQAETDSAIRKTARLVMSESDVEGDSFMVPPVEDLVTALVSRVRILERGLTHPQIHIDYYAWLGSLSEFDRNFMNTASPNGIAMWAWSQGRERLRAEARKKAAESHAESPAEGGTPSNA